MNRKCGLCQKYIRKNEKKYLYHETEDGFHKIGGKLNFDKNRVDASQNHVCQDCYSTNSRKVFPGVADTCRVENALIVQLVIPRCYSVLVRMRLFALSSIFVILSIYF